MLFTACNFEKPVEFSEGARTDVMVTADGEEVSFESILEKNEGKTILINIWAAWCKDCIIGMPDFEKLQERFPEVEYVFLSLERSEAGWRNAMRKYPQNGQHYYIKSGWDGPFCESIRMNWIPRYMVVDSEGKIKLFKATKVKSNKISEALL